MLYFVATEYGFMAKVNSRHCVRNVRMAHPFKSFGEADTAAKAVFGTTYFAVLGNCIGE